MTTQWIITLAITLIAGGAMGSVIGIIATNRRNRIQPIGVSKEIIPFVNQKLAGPTAKAEILLKVGDKQQSYSNLVLGRIVLKNTGNSDYQEFKFGITLNSLNLAVYLQTETPDRSHVITSSPEIDLNHIDSEIDFTLQPFNRGDVYNISLFILPVTEDIEMSLSTAHPVEFADLLEYRALATSIFLEMVEGMHFAGMPVGLPLKRMRRLIK